MLSKSPFWKLKLDTKKCPAEKSGAGNYLVEEFTDINYPHSVRMSFEMAFPDWCKFQKSDVFRSLIKYLRELESQDNLPEKHGSPD